MSGYGIAVACVYKSGGDFDAKYVSALARSVGRHLRTDYHFICLTDQPAEVAAEGPLGGGEHSCVLPLAKDWPGWFSKIELFALRPPILYFDLDTVICGDITPLAEWILDESKSRFLMCRDPYNGVPQTGVMGWNREQWGIFQQFSAVVPHSIWTRKNSHAVYLNAVVKRFDGDAEWIRPMVCGGGPDRPEVGMAQDILPGVISFKDQVQKDRTPRTREDRLGPLPEGARVVLFHGHPRPHEVPQEGWMLEHWSGRDKVPA